MRVREISFLRPLYRHHIVRAVATKTGFPYYFDMWGNAYIWCKGALRKQHPTKLHNPRTLIHNKNGGYLLLHSASGTCRGKYDRGHLYVHRGVALAFPNICGVPDLFRNQVDHINGDKWDNRACNLRWLTQSENVRARGGATESPTMRNL